MNRILLDGSKYVTPALLQQLACESAQSKRALILEMPLDGVPRTTEKYQLSDQYLIVAYIGQCIRDACEFVNCYLPETMHSPGSVGFLVIPSDVDKFVEKLWLSTPVFKASDRRVADSTPDILMAALELQDAPTVDVCFPQLVERANDLWDWFDDMEFQESQEEE